VIAPYDAQDAKGLMKAAIRTEDPVVFLENELIYGQSFEVAQLDDHVLPIGKARIMREGSDVTIVAYSIAVGIALEAAEGLAEQGIDAEVIDLRTIRPLDRRTIVESVKKTNRCVVVDEAWPFAGVSSEVAYEIQKSAFDYLDAPVIRVNSADTSLGYAPTLVEEYLPNPAKIIRAVKEVSYVK